MMTKKHLFIVDTISTFRLRYVVEAESLEHAYDEVIMKDSGNEKDAFREITQKYVGEQIIDGREISRSALEAYIVEVQQDDSESAILPDTLDEHIRRINYGQGN